MLSYEDNSVKSIVESGLDARIHQLGTSACSFAQARATMDDWHEQRCYTVFTAGTFDLLTLNHIVGLVQCRVLGGMGLLGITKIETADERAAVHDVAASDRVRLMVTMDTDAALERSKSRRPEKGGAPKPTLGWDTRAMMLTAQSVPSRDGPMRHQAVDYVTRHGPGCCASCQMGACTSEDNARMTVGLQPRLVVVNADSTNTVDDLLAYKGAGLLPRTEIAFNVETENQYHDPILDGPVKTTTIIQRIRS